MVRGLICTLLTLIAVAFVFNRMAHAQEGEGVDVGGAAGGSSGDKPATPFFRGPEGIIANLLDRKGALRVVRVNLQILVKVPEINHKRLRELWPEIAQEVGFILANYRVEDLKSRAASERLRAEIKAMVVNLFIKYFKDKESIEDIFFEELVAQ